VKAGGEGPIETNRHQGAILCIHSAAGSTYLIGWGSTCVVFYGRAHGLRGLPGTIQTAQDHDHYLGDRSAGMTDFDIVSIFPMVKENRLFEDLMVPKN